MWKIIFHKQVSLYNSHLLRFQSILKQLSRYNLLHFTYITNSYIFFQVTVIPQQKSTDSDVMYNTTINNTTIVTSIDSHEEESCDKIAAHVKTEPFIIVREALHDDERGGTRTPELQKSEANILDLNDVEFADASDNDDSFGEKKPEPDAMTPAEAENLLSTQLVFFFTDSPLYRVISRW